MDKKYDFYDSYDDKSGKGVIIFGSCLLGLFFLIISFAVLIDDGNPFALIITLCYISIVFGYIYYQKKNSKLSDDFVPTTKSKEELMNDYAIQHNIKEKRQKEREEYIKKSQQYILNKTLENVPRCPTCNSTKVEKISTTKRWVSTGLFGLASSNIGKTMHCKNCGYKW